VDRWLVASTKDLAQVSDVYLEHGCGLAWHRKDALSRIAEARTILVPNGFLADRYRAAGIDVEVIGTPKMDDLLGLPMGEAVGIGFHWTSVAYSYILRDYEAAIRELATKVEVIGHGHPRAWSRLEPYWRALGIEPVHDFERVVQRTNLWVCDHSSTLYEYAALDRPVILAEGPARRPFEPTGLRYEHWGDIGFHADPSSLVGTVLEALEAPETHTQARRDATAALFPYLGSSVKRVLDVLEATTWSLSSRSPT
jgi:hypothetical protein